MKFWVRKEEGMMFPPFYYGFVKFEYPGAFLFCIWPFSIIVRLWNIFLTCQNSMRHYMGIRSYYNDAAIRCGQLESERRETIATMREICTVYGDNDWDATQRLSYIIEKHLLLNLIKKGM